MLAHLAGFYGQVDCRVIIEINGAGTAVWQELMSLQQKCREMKVIERYSVLGPEGKDLAMLLLRLGRGRLGH